MNAQSVPANQTGGGSQADSGNSALSGIWRRCNITNLAVDRNAELLIMVNAVTAVVYLAIGGIGALLIALTRWEAVHLLSADWYYRITGAHGTAMLIFWILFFEVAGLIFGCTVILNRSLYWPRVMWAAYGIMLVGSIALLATLLSGEATVMFTAYPPLQATSWFYLSFILFAVGTLLAVIVFIVNIANARYREHVGPLPLFTFAMLAAAILAIWTLLSGAAALIPTWLWSLGLVSHVDAGVYRLLFWGFGHGAQQVNLVAMVGIWYVLAALTVGARPVNEGVSRFAFLLIIMFIHMGAIHHIMVDPGFSFFTFSANASYFVYAATLGSMIHALSIPAAVELAQRRKGFGSGLFTWLKRAPWKEPGFSSLVLSFWLFGVMGGISGVIMGTVQTNMIQHNTLIVPAHFHMTVVAGTTLAFMGLAYYLIPLIFRRDNMFPTMAKLQPYVFAGGMTIWGLGMGVAGHFGLSRRHWDSTFGGSPLGNNVFQIPEIDWSLFFLGIGGMIAVVGGAMFIINAVATVFLGKKTSTPYLPGIDPEALTPADERTREAGGDQHRGFEFPGTLILVFGFLALFMLLYATSWLELSRVPWTIR
jgi:cytochrome c oxidase subunit I